MMEIQLTNTDLYVLIDDEDFDMINKHNWYVHNYNGIYNYAETKSTKNKKKSMIKMHRLILNAQKGQLVDHINHNTLDNRKENLRICTSSENSQNRQRVWGRSSFKGVRWHKGTGKWHSRIMFNKKGISLGLFSSEEDAARAYDEAAKKYFGEFACLNFGGDLN